MTLQGWTQIALYVVVLTALTPLIGAYMARVYAGDRVLLVRVLGPLERGIYRVLRTDPEEGQDWKGYARTTLVFSAVFFVLLYVILRTQGIHPFNPEGYKSGTWDLSFNTAASFLSNTNWQYYGGETTLSYFSQMTGLAVQNFISAAVAMAVLVAVIRGFAAHSTSRARQLLGRPHALAALHPAADLHRRRADPRLAGRHPDACALRDLPDGRPAASRRSRSGRSPPRRSSRSSARTAAASSTSTRRCRSRTRRGSRTSSSCC